MTNFEKIKHISSVLQCLIDDGIIDEENCDSVLEEIYSVMEILVDCNEELEGVFDEEMKVLAPIISNRKDDAK